MMTITAWLSTPSQLVFVLTNKVACIFILIFISNLYTSTKMSSFQDQSRVQSPESFRKTEVLENIEALHFWNMENYEIQE